MKIYTLAGLALACAALMGCATGGGSGGTSPLDIAKQTVTAARSAHQGAGVLLSAGAKTGLVHGVAATTAKTYFDQAESYLGLADLAIAAGDIAGAEVNAGKSTTASGQATAASKGN